MGLKAMAGLPSNIKATDVPKYVGEIYLSFIHEPMEAPPDIVQQSAVHRFN